MERQYVAIDLHRHRSLILRQNEHGEELGVVRIDNDPTALASALAEAGPDPEVAIEAIYGWYWAVDVLESQGANVHLVNWRSDRSTSGPPPSECAPRRTRASHKLRTVGPTGCPRTPDRRQGGQGTAGC